MATAVRTLNATIVCKAQRNERARSSNLAKSLRAPSSVRVGRRNAMVSVNITNPFAKKQPVRFE
eukprot:1000102-Prorocentrum_minimum.AAC.4